MRFCTALVMTLLVELPIGLLALPTPAKCALQNERLRTRLETLFNEQDLMIRNQKVDRGDLEHQLKEFEALKTFQRIPFRTDIAGLKSSLQEAAQERGLKFESLKVLPHSGKMKKSVPISMYTDENPRFQLTDDQIAEKIPFKAIVRGERGAVRAWILAWPEEQMRIAEPVGRSPDQSMRRIGKDRWEVQAHAFRFRDIKFPTLRPRDPLKLLPPSVRHDPRVFSKKEPLLWSFVTRTQAISPKALPLYRLREELLLNSARMSFFVAKAVPRH